MFSTHSQYRYRLARALTSVMLVSSPLFAQTDHSIGFRSAVASPNHVVRIPQDPTAPFPTRDLSIAFLIQLDALPTTANHIVMSHGRTSTQPLPWSIQIGSPAVGSSCGRTFSPGEIALVWEGPGGNDVRVASGLVLPVGGWQHIAVTRSVDITTGRYIAKFYNNGALVSTMTQLACGGNPPNVSQVPVAFVDRDLAVGKTIELSGTPAGELDASLDEIALWGRVIDDAEVASLFSGAVARPLGSATCPGLTLESGLVGYWRFNESVAEQMVIDWSGLGNHGHLGQVPSVEFGEPLRALSTAPLAYARQITAAAACALGAPAGLVVSGLPGGVLNVSLPTPGAFAMVFGSCTAPWPVCPGAVLLPRLDIILAASGPAALFVPWPNLPFFSEIYVQAVGLGAGVLTGVTETWLIRGL